MIQLRCLAIQSSALAQNSARLECTDERDRLYGMLAVADPNNTLSIQVEYQSPAEKMWNDLAMKLLLSGDLSILHYAGTPSEGFPRTRSFATDLGRLSYGVRFGGKDVSPFRAGNEMSVEVKLSAEGTPQLRGVKVGIVDNYPCISRLFPRVVREEDFTPIIVAENGEPVSDSESSIEHLIGNVEAFLSLVDFDTQSEGSIHL